MVWTAAYYVGMLKILELRDNVSDELGEAFDLKGFHSIVLKNGSVPLEILEQVVETCIVSKKQASSSMALCKASVCPAVKCYDEG